MSWNETKETIRKDLQSAGPDRTPFEIYEDEISQYFREYKEMLEEANFGTDLREPEKGDGISSGEVSARLEINSFKVPTINSAYGTQQPHLAVKVSTRDKKVILSGFLQGEDEETYLEKKLGNLEESSLSKVFSNFTENLRRAATGE